jgi:hypothetical protein
MGSGSQRIHACGIVRRRRIGIMRRHDALWSGASKKRIIQPLIAAQVTASMRRIAIFALLVLALAGCTQATASRIDDRTFLINGPGIPGGSDAPNRRVAARLCPNGYRVIDSINRRNSPDGYRDDIGSIYTNWTIRCI